MTSPTPPAFPPALPPAPHVPRGNTRRFATPRTVMALILREMSTQYGRTPGGYLWAILEPLAAILFLSIGFSLVMRTPALGTSFLLFYATGFLPFDLYNRIANTTGRALNFSKPLLKYPAVTWLDAIIARFFLNSLTGTIVAVLLLGGILTVIDSRAVLDPARILGAMGLTMLLGLGVGTLNCVLLGLFPLWEVTWSILNRPLFLASGVFFLYDDLPPMAQNILWYNPLMHVTGLMRTGFYPTYSGAYISLPYVILLSMTLLAMGLILMGRYHQDILNR
jgi:capsular polysaccharide transport system permease protein